MRAKTKLLHFIEERCMGCHACEIACKSEHNLPVGVNRVCITTEGPLRQGSKLELRFKRIACHHCPDSPCVRVCPTSAIQQRKDSIVWINHSLCIGCQSCASACPYNAIQFHPHENYAEICDICVDRLDQELNPFCVQPWYVTCPQDMYHLQR